MKRLLFIFITLISTINFSACGKDDTIQNSHDENSGEEQNNIKLSDQYVSITSNNLTSVFRLYDTQAARQFYDQLPLNLSLSNFRDAQWMFYPPNKLDVTVAEAYHDGKKGELSYYQPWGDVFMLYKDFYAADEMHRLGVPISGIDKIQEMTGNVRIEKNNGNNKNMKIRIILDSEIITATMYDNTTAEDFISLLPLTLTLNDYASSEKVSNLPKELSITGAPSGFEPSAGDITLYAPWGNLAIFYKDAGYANGLVSLGKVDSGIEALQVSSSVLVTIELINE